MYPSHEDSDPRPVAVLGKEKPAQEADLYFIVPPLWNWAAPGCGTLSR